MTALRYRGLIRLGVLVVLFIAIGLGIEGMNGHRAAAAGTSANAGAKASAAYVTTAHYLNVREGSSAKTRIVKVLKQGTAISVVGRTDSGWLQLAEGGYVHGDYAKKADGAGDPPPSAGVKPLASAKPKAAAPKPAVKPAIKAIYNVQARSGLTKEAIQANFKGTGLAGQNLEEAILSVESEFGINAYFTIAIMKLESGNGNSRIAKTRNNLFGLNSSNGTGYLRFKTKVDSVNRFGQLIADSYIGKGYTTIEQIAKRYCPSNGKWPSMIKGIIDRDNKAYLAFVKKKPPAV